MDTYADHGFDGRVTAVYPQAEIRDNVVNYVAVVRFDPPRGPHAAARDDGDRAGGARQRSGVLALPRRAVRREDGRTSVGAATGSRRHVGRGTRREHVEIVDGVREGDEVPIGGREGE